MWLSSGSHEIWWITLINSPALLVNFGSIPRLVASPSASLRQPRARVSISPPTGFPSLPSSSLRAKARHGGSRRRPQEIPAGHGQRRRRRREALERNGVISNWSIKQIEALHQVFQHYRMPFWRGLSFLALCPWWVSSSSKNTQSRQPSCACTGKSSYGSCCWW